MSPDEAADLDQGRAASLREMSRTYPDAESDTLPDGTPCWSSPTVEATDVRVVIGTDHGRTLPFLCAYRSIGVVALYRKEAFREPGADLGALLYDMKRKEKTLYAQLVKYVTRGDR